MALSNRKSEASKVLQSPLYHVMQWLVTVSAWLSAGMFIFMGMQDRWSLVMLLAALIAFMADRLLRVYYVELFLLNDRLNGGHSE
jgi:uncharacterized membrane protein YjjP (DUF1212 family)